MTALPGVAELTRTVNRLSDTVDKLDGTVDSLRIANAETRTRSEQRDKDTNILFDRTRELAEKKADRTDLDDLRTTLRWATRTVLITALTVFGDLVVVLVRGATH